MSNDTYATPKDVEVKMVNDTHANVTWTPVSRDNIIRYKVQIECPRQMICCGPCNSSMHDVQNDTFFLFPVLGVTKYTVSVSAGVESKYGNFSDPVEIPGSLNSTTVLASIILADSRKAMKNHDDTYEQID
ncbi:hypothetical protein SK128_015115 [Halocaridina rubra]|uniref:Fibronectin type-III domain-containing protein n=1 Tax=Halocaridina rubra TaxID=373956 RepID=A0AAN8WMD1_HALRR